MIREPARLRMLLLSLALWLGLLGATVLGLSESRPGLVITEFMAANGSTLADQDGDYPDWIEIHNQGTGEIDLDGWYLTDSHSNRAKWRFPGVRLAPGGYLIVFASGKDRALPGAELHTNFGLDSSGEYLALVKPNGRTIAWEYHFEGTPQFRDVSYGLDAAQSRRHFAAPTAGAANGATSTESGPILSSVSHAPSQPTAADSITVTAAVKGSLATVDNVTLYYRVMYQDTVAVSMLDDGRHGDGAAADDVYGAIIPSHAYRSGEMVRYYVTAADTGDHASRWPLFHDPANSPEYLGTMIADPTSGSLLPILYWFAADPAAAESRSGTRASVFYEGAFYDNVFVRRRGFASSHWPKKSLKFDFHPGHHFRFSPSEGPVEEFNLISTSNDTSYLRQILAWETYRDAGVPCSISFPMRVQQNGAFYSVAVFVEEPDERLLERLGLDPNGAFYKMKRGSVLSPAGNNAVKRTRLDEDDSDLQALVSGIHLPGSARTKYLFDHINIPAILNYQAAATIIHDRDQGYNNYFLYRDTEGTGEWMFLPWDKDLTFGLYHNDELDIALTVDHDPQSRPLACYKHNDLIDALYETPVTQEMFLRRLRTLMDELLQPPGTPIRERYYERRIDELFTQMQLDVTLDAARWPIEGIPQTLAQGVHSLRVDYLDARRVHLFETHGPSNRGIIPDAQPITTTLRFGEMGFVSAPQDQDEEYLTLVNDNRYAVDISGWRIAGAVEVTFQPGVVIPAGGTLYVSPDVVAFRGRAISPTGGEGHFVQGDYEGQLSNTAGILNLYNAEGMMVASRSYLGLSPLNQ